VRDILAQSPATWGFPALDGIAEAPVLRPDGTILHTPGYDAATLLYYAPDPALVVPHIPDRPTAADMDSALELLHYVLADFPFVDGDKEECPSRANALAAMLTPIVKPAIAAPAPLGLFDAPAAGTGKSLLAEVGSIIATGRPAEMMSAPRDFDEWRKMITTALLAGTAVIVIDNVTCPLDNPDLCKVLTETTHSDRAFHTQEKLVLPVKASFYATGNNIRVGGDMPRRCYWIRIDAESSRPFERSGFRIPDLKAWVIQRRGDLLTALLTLTRAWFAAGRPKPAVKPLGNFEAWCNTVGGILEYAGIPGFLGNRDALLQEGDPDSTQWENFLLVMAEEFGSVAFTASELFKTLSEYLSSAQSPSARAARLKSALPDFIAEGFAKGDGFFQRRAGKCFAERVGRRFGESQIHLKRGGIDHHAQQWLVVNPCRELEK
jgi:hypothetical protein